MAASSPSESLPSLANVSRASSDSDDITRILFGTPEEDDKEVAEKSDEHEKDSSVFASDASIVSLTSFAAEIKSVASKNERTDSSSPVKTESDAGYLEDGVPFQPSCHAGLNLSAKQLAGVFTLFDSSEKRWPTTCASETSGADASTAVTGNLAPPHSDQWTPKEASLEHECSTLKQIINADSINILKLKNALETLRANASKNALEIKQLKSQLGGVKRERDLMKEREAQHLETIKVLKQEVDALTRVRSASSPDTHKELEQLRVENELFATQIIENEVEMREIRSVLEFLDTENARMRQELDSVQGTLYFEARGGETKESTECLTKQIESLAARITEVEREREQSRLSLEDEKRNRTKELESIKQMIMTDYLSKPTSSVIETKGEEVEVTLDGPVSPENEARKKEKKADSWVVLCNCFPSSNNKKEE